jgi:NAD(P)-dependent dehydrogenase (short-subunit alcohol dehydrogenase family)
MDLGLKGKNVLITGGSKGIGRAIVLGFAAEGANVATCALNAEHLHQVEEAVRTLGVSVFVQTCDVENAGALDAFLEATPSRDFAYAPIKAALISYSNKMAVNLASLGIRVNSVAPGSIEFEGGLWAGAKKHNPGLYNVVVASIPWGRLGTPEEVADAVVFLASDRARWITGACLVVDGGQHKGNL